MSDGERNAARALQRAMERNQPGRMDAIVGSSWQLWHSFEALWPEDDTLGADEPPAFLETYERGCIGEVF